MIDDKDRDSLVEYRLSQAFDTIDLAKFLASNDKYRGRMKLLAASGRGINFEK